MLPFKKYTKLLIIELMHFVTMQLNAFPMKNGISRVLSPRELIRRHRLDVQLHCQAPFGAYCEVHDEPAPLNSMQRHTHAAICLGPTGNLQGSYCFLCLETGKCITHRNFTELPMPQSVIDRVHHLATAENSSDGLTF